VFGALLHIGRSPVTARAARMNDLTTSWHLPISVPKAPLSWDLLRGPGYRSYHQLTLARCSLADARTFDTDRVADCIPIPCAATVALGDEFHFHFHFFSLCYLCCYDTFGDPSGWWIRIPLHSRPSGLARPPLAKQQAPICSVSIGLCQSLRLWRSTGQRSETSLRVGLPGPGSRLAPGQQTKPLL
jgi:hypothetical protein